MKDESDPADGGMVDPHDAEPDNPGLEAWLARTTTPLDILALCTIWLTLVPINRVHEVGGHPIWWFVARIALSVVYGIDIAVRTRLSNVGTRYLVRHPVAVLAVLMPVLRLLFSIRLLGAMFRKGNLGHFLSVAALLFLNLVIIVWGFENREAGANITTIWLGIWWGFVTVATVGYGDYYPITVGGRIFAVMLMGLGLITIAVITAQIASSFMDRCCGHGRTD
jgi:voltage-gated potassium channel